MFLLMVVCLFSDCDQTLCLFALKSLRGSVFVERGRVQNYSQYGGRGPVPYLTEVVLSSSRFSLATEILDDKNVPNDLSAKNPRDCEQSSLFDFFTVCVLKFL